MSRTITGGLSRCGGRSRARSRGALPPARGGAGSTRGAGPEAFSPTSGPERRPCASDWTLRCRDSFWRGRGGLPDSPPAPAAPRRFRGEHSGIVTSIDVLCHRGVEEEAALREAHRCLEPGGLLILQVPAFSWLSSEHDRAVWTNRRFRRAEVEALLERPVFTLRESFYRMSLLFPAAALRRLGKKRPRPEPEARSDVRPASAFVNPVFGALLRVAG